MMKKILATSILAVTAFLSMAGQANAAPDYDKHHAAQVKQQKHDSKVKVEHKHKVENKHKVDDKHKVAKNKAVFAKQKAKEAAAKHRKEELAKQKMHDKKVREHRS